MMHTCPSPTPPPQHSNNKHNKFISYNTFSISKYGSREWVNEQNTIRGTTICHYYVVLVADDKVMTRQVKVYTFSNILVNNY